MAITHETADSRLADAIWWFKGFRAANAPTADTSDPTESLGDQLREVRAWLNRLPLGLSRAMGTNERALGVVLTEYELEVLIDGLQANTPQDRDAGLAKAREIHAQFRREVQEERQRFTHPEALF